MKIYIPTRGRTEQQRTWNHFPEAIQKQAILVCPPDEVAAHRAAGRRAMARPVSGIANVRQWLVDQALAKGETKICQCDDDFWFAMRKAPTDRHQVPLPKQRYADLFGRVEKLLDIYPLVGVSQTAHNDKLMESEVKPGLAENRRVCGLYGIRTDIMTEAGIKFNVTEWMSDLHVTLSFLEHGFKTALITEFMWRQVSGAKGGCAIDRDIPALEKAAIRLQELHPGVVDLARRTTTSVSWGKGERVDVTVHWSRASLIGAQKKRKKLF